MKIYIAGKITGNINYLQQFAQMQRIIESDGHIVLNPALLPSGMNPKDYMKICFAMIDVADKVVFMHGWRDSMGANLEYQYCLYCGKELINLQVKRIKFPEGISR